jgi:hypothetical protein
VEGEARSAQQAADVILKSNEATQIRRTWLGFVEGANGSFCRKSGIRMTNQKIGRKEKGMRVDKHLGAT